MLVGLVFALLFVPVARAAPQGEWLTSATLAEAGAPRTRVDLPDNWNERVAGRGGTADYVLEFPLHRADGELGLYVPRLSRKAEVVLNGVAIATLGRLETPVMPSWSEPQFLALPQSALAEGSNTLVLRLVAEPRSRAGLSAVYVGPADAARALYERRVFWQTQLPKFFELLMAVFALAITALWLANRSEAALGWFALSAWLWSARLHQLFLPELGISHYTSELLAAVSVQGSQLAQIVMTLRLRGLHARRLEGLLGIWFAAGLVGLLAAPHQRATAAVLVCMFTPAIAMGFHFNVLLGIAAWRRRDTAAVACTLLILASLAFGLHDHLILSGVLAFDRMFIMRYAGPLMVLAVAGLLIGRYTQSLRAAEAANAQLELRIAEKTRQLQEQFELSRARELELTLLAERDRFARDMHDGIGSRLITARASLAGERLSAEELRLVLDDCLADLRLILDSFDPQAASLDAMLGDFRVKSMPGLAAVFERVEWPVDGLQACAWLDAKSNLAVLRVLQEMLANAMKHGQRDLQVVTRCGDDAIEIRVVNRVRIATAGAPPQRSHRGLASMSERARRAGAVFRFEHDGAIARATYALERAAVPVS